ncbi:ventral expressed homeobox isoform X2 [Pseudorasbora parva]|uniref:ventral expressed homeobox isoform X2 n=1 Tax=Pseudorasbora parva TaxID=51549 RepID=UPI00351F74A1
MQTSKLTTHSCGFSSADDSEGDLGPLRRVRTKFTGEQISQLEKSFGKHQYLGAAQRRSTADRLHLTETQVKTWFQNRRMKLKREVQDMRAAEFLAPIALPPVTSFQHHAMSGQRARLCHPARALHCSPVHVQPLIQPLFAPCYF